MVTKRGKQASRKAAARKIGFLEVPLSLMDINVRGLNGSEKITGTEVSKTPR